MAKTRTEISTRYNSLFTKQYNLRLNKNTDADLIEFFDSLDNKQGFVKRIVRKSGEFEAWKNSRP